MTYTKYFFLTVTADYKALKLLMARKSSDNEVIKQFGGRGMDTEFCIYCLAIRVRKNVKKISKT